MIGKILRQFKAYGLKGLIGNLLWEIYMRARWFLLNSYSQGNEDIIIDNLLNRKSRGFYVDIGAFNPTRFSNTKRFYSKGWRGINIEPDPLKITKFHKERSKDLNLNIGISDQEKILPFFKFDPSTLSTFSNKTAENYIKKGHKLVKTINIKVSKLGKVLSKNQIKRIDFFSIDTEGFDLKVLKGNNWKKFKPKVICIETSSNEIDNMLYKLGYKKITETKINSIFYYEGI